MLDDQINGNMKMSSDSYLIEMDDDRINITTMAMAESTDDNGSMLHMSSAESAFVSHLSNNDGNNNSHSSDSGTNAKVTEIGHMRGGVYDAYHMSSGEINLENESVVRLKTHEPLDRSTIDTIISQVN